MNRFILLRASLCLLFSLNSLAVELRIYHVDSTDVPKSIKNRSCEITLVENDKNGELLQVLERAFSEKGYKVGLRVDEKQYNPKQFKTGDLWAHAYLDYNFKIMEGVPLNESAHWHGRILLETGAENKTGWEMIANIAVFENGYLAPDKNTALTRLIGNIPTCEVQ